MVRHCKQRSVGSMGGFHRGWAGERRSHTCELRRPSGYEDTDEASGDDVKDAHSKPRKSRQVASQS